MNKLLCIVFDLNRKPMYPLLVSDLCRTNCNLQYNTKNLQSILKLLLLVITNIFIIIYKLYFRQYPNDKFSTRSYDGYPINEV